MLLKLEASRGIGAQSVTVKPTGCGFDSHSMNIYLNLYFHFFALVSRTSAALRSATHHVMPSEFGRKWGTECLNTRFPLPPLQCAGYSVKLICYLNCTSLQKKRQKSYYILVFFIFSFFIFSKSLFEAIYEYCKLFYSFTNPFEITKVSRNTRTGTRMCMCSFIFTASGREKIKGFKYNARI